MTEVRTQEGGQRQRAAQMTLPKDDESETVKYQDTQKTSNLIKSFYNKLHTSVTKNFIPPREFGTELNCSYCFV